MELLRSRDRLRQGHARRRHHRRHLCRAGTITAETVVGAVVGYGVAALEICRMLDLWAEATRAMTSIYSLVQASAGLIEAQVSRLQGADLPELSGNGAYHHPLAAS
jgi:hypothetical protein